MKNLNLNQKKQQIHPPTCVSHACSIRWTTPSAAAAVGNSSRGNVEGNSDSDRPPPDVAVVCGSRLSLYSVRVPGDDARSRGKANVSIPSEALDKARLELVCDLSLAGAPTSVCTIPARAVGLGQRDALLLTFREAKAVVLDWDEALCRPRPSSLHLLSRGDGTTAGELGDNSSGKEDASELAAALLPRAHARAPRAAADPEGRCAAVSFFGHRLALLPSMEVDALDALLGADDDEDDEEERKRGTAAANETDLPFSAAAAPPPPPRQRLLPSSVGNAVPIDLRPLGVRDVVDLCFARRAAAPTLLLLHAADPKGWGAAAPSRAADGCALLAVAADDALLLSGPGNSNSRHRRLPARLWSAPNLPSDARSISATPRGGAVVLCHRLLLHIAPGGGGLQAIALSPAAVPLPVRPPRLAIDSHVEVPAVTAARHASAWGTRLHPDAAPAVAGGGEIPPSSSSSSSSPLIPPPEGLDADGCGASLTWLPGSGSSALLATAEGQLLVLRLPQAPSSSSPYGRGSLSLTKAGIASPRASLASLGPGLIFLGSWGGDSLLLRSTSEAAERERVLLLKGGEGGGREEERAQKRRKRTKANRLEAERRGLGDDAKGEEDDEIAGKDGDGGGNDTDVGSDDDIEEAKADDDGGGAPPDPRRASKRPLSSSSSERTAEDAFAFSVLDSLSCTGPVRSAALAEGLGLTTAAAGGAGAGRSVSASAAGFAPDPPLLLAGVGTGRSGALLATRRSVAAEVITRVPLPGLTGAWALHSGEGGGGGNGGGRGGFDAAAVAAALSSSSPPSSLLASASPPRGAAPGAPWGYHDLLLLSVSTGAFGGATRVLRAGDALDEVLDGSSGFETVAPTLAAGALSVLSSSNSSSVAVAAAQVHPRGVSLVVAGTPCRGVSAAELLGAGAGGAAQQLVAGAVAGRFVAARSAAGAAGVARLDAASSSDASSPCALSPIRIPRLNSSGGSSSNAVTAVALFIDEEGWFGGRSVGGGSDEEGGKGGGAAAAVVALAARADGSLELYSLPSSSATDSARLLAIYTGAGDGARALEPRAMSSSSAAQEKVVSAAPQASTSTSTSTSTPLSPFPAILELLVFHPGPSDADGLPDEDGPRTSPLLLARAADGSVRAWRAARRDGGRGAPEEEEEGGGASSSSALPRFVRAPLSGLEAPPGPRVPRGFSSPSPPRLVAFECLGEAAPRHSGVFVCGGGGGGEASSSSAAHPGWWLVSSRGSLVAHPHHASGPLVSAAAAAVASPLPVAATGFTPFHNVNCSQGFVAAIAPSSAPIAATAAAGQSSVHICAMPRAVRLDTPWPSQRAPLRGTPAALAWHAPARLAAVGLHRPAAAPRAPLQAQAGGDPAAAYAYAAASAAVTGGVTPPGCSPLLNKKKGADDVRLLSAGRWATAWRAPLLPGERATAAASVALRDGGPGNAAGALVPVVAFGAASAFGEDYPASGRVLLVEVRRTATTGGGERGGQEQKEKKPRSYRAALAGDPNWEAEVVYSREFRGPVTAVSAIDGALIVAYGSRVEALAWGEFLFLERKK